MALFIEIRRDKHGNRSGPFAVVEGYKEEGNDHLVIVAPEEAKKHFWPIKYIQEVSEDAGPARMLDEQGGEKTIREMDQMIADYGVL